MQSFYGCYFALLWLSIIAALFLLLLQQKFAFPRIYPQILSWGFVLCCCCCWCQVSPCDSECMRHLLLYKYFMLQNLCFCFFLFLKIRKRWNYGKLQFQFLMVFWVDLDIKLAIKLCNRKQEKIPKNRECHRQSLTKSMWQHMTSYVALHKNVRVHCSHFIWLQFYIA